jgi:nitroreductase
VDFADIVKKRRMVRRFKTDPIARDPHPKGMNLIRSALNIPEHFTPVGIMPIGYPLPDKPSPSLKRGAVNREDFTRCNGWSVG